MNGPDTGQSLCARESHAASAAPRLRHNAAIDARRLRYLRGGDHREAEGACRVTHPAVVRDDVGDANRHGGRQVERVEGPDVGAGKKVRLAEQRCGHLIQIDSLEEIRYRFLGQGVFTLAGSA